MPTIERIKKSLAVYSPEMQREAERRAAVAVVLRATSQGDELLFIERARHELDPWSGHMAFPGGRVDPGDASDRHAAERETLEEVGVSLSDARYLGRLDDLEGRNAGRKSGLVISAHVYHSPDPAPLTPNEEVAEAFWFPVRELLAPHRHVDYTTPQVEGISFPGILVGQPDRHIVWGLTYRFLEVMFEAIGKPLPNRWSSDSIRGSDPGATRRR